MFGGWFLALIEYIYIFIYICFVFVYVVCVYAAAGGREFVLKEDLETPQT